MKPMALSAMLTAGLVVALGGCTSSQSRLAAWETDREVALTVISGDEAQQSVDAGEFRLGAGDTLGRAVYHNYVAVVRANSDTHFASGETSSH